MIQLSAFFTKILSYITVFFLLIGALFSTEKIDLSDLPETADASYAQEAYPERYEKMLKSPAVKDFAALLDAERSAPIPGIKYAAVTTDGGAISLCDAMTPQGVCFAGKNGQYLLISAYCNDEALENSAYHKDVEEKHESVIYVLDADSGALLTTVTVDSYSEAAKQNKTGAPPHAGGIAYDGAYLWIAKTNGILAVDFAKIEAIAESGAATGRVSCEAAKETFTGVDGETVAEYCSDEPISAFRLDTRASFVSTYNDLLIVGEYQTEGTATLSAYKIALGGGEMTMAEQFRAQIPLHAQGAYILDRDGGTYLFVSRSAGAVATGELFVYELSVDGGSAEKTALAADIPLPNMCEDLDVKDGYLYICYESAANRYYAWNKPVKRSLLTTDRITAIDIGGLIG